MPQLRNSPASKTGHGAAAQKRPRGKPGPDFNQTGPARLLTVLAADLIVLELVDVHCGLLAAAIFFEFERHALTFIQT